MSKLKIRQKVNLGTGSLACLRRSPPVEGHDAGRSLIISHNLREFSGASDADGWGKYVGCH